MNPNGNPRSLRPWTKGQSGNPGGRPKHSIRRALEALAAQEHDGRALYEAVAAMAWKLALSGDLDAIKWVTDQLDGKLPQTTVVDGSLEHDVHLTDVLAAVRRLKSTGECSPPAR